MEEQEQKNPVVVIPLTYPIRHGSETITELVIENRPRAKHFRELPAQGQKMDDMLKLLSKITGQPRSVIDELDAEDMFKASEVVMDFLPDSLKTGGSL